MLNDTSFSYLFHIFYRTITHAICSIKPIYTPSNIAIWSNTKVIIIHRPYANSGHIFYRVLLSAQKPSTIESRTKRTSPRDGNKFAHKHRNFTTPNLQVWQKLRSEIYYSALVFGAKSTARISSAAPMSERDYNRIISP